MKIKNTIISMAILAMVSGCNSGPRKYASENDFPEYKGNDLGVVYSEKCSKFRVWAPAASEVNLKIYNNGLDGDAEKSYKMKCAENGTWTYEIDENLKGKFYTFQVKVDGAWLDETPGIWAKAAGVNGNRAAIIDFAQTNPEGWENDKRPELKHFSDIVLYEIHVRDFSISPNSGMKNKGKFLAFAESGTRTPEGETTGLDHLKELGVTHIHLLPSFDYASVDETKLDENKYNWGYDPKNYNLPEGGYSTNPYEPTTRIREFKQMVKTLHNNGLRVVMDVVYNHTFANEGSNLYLTAQKYFYRYNADGTWSNASGCHNETASERAMMRRFMIESVKYWATEYHIDGFRFDLMGIHDIETMNEIRAELNKIDTTIFMYGEGWTGGPSPLAENLRAVKSNAPKMPGIAVFSDDIRDALKGKWNNPKVSGFVSGIEGNEESIKFGIVGATQNSQINYSKVNDTKAPYALAPTQTINYVSCHDDLCLVDKLRESAPADSTDEEMIRYNKLAQTIVITSQGVPFIYAGEEIFRTKQGVHNTFESPDSINQIDWSRKSKYKDVFNYYKGLIALRKKYSAFRMNTTEEIKANLKFLQCDKNLVSYIIDGRANANKWEDVVVVLNGNRHAINYKLPEGRWLAVCHNGEINVEGIEKMQGTMQVAPSSASILVRSLK